MTRTLLAAILLLASPLLLAAGTLRVGLSPDYPPMQYQQEGQFVGIEVDNATAVAKILGKRLMLFPLAFDQLIPALEQGEIDVIMSGLSVTEERAGKVLFTDPMMIVGQMAILHRSKLASFSQPWAIYREGVRVGVEPDTTGARFAEQQLPDAEVIFFSDPDAAFAGLRDNSIDLYIHDAPTSWRLANSSDTDDLFSTYKPLTREALAWAVNRNNPQLAAELNRALAMMQSSGTLQYILNRWIPVQVEVQ